jgi:hypothetical protein
MSDPGLSAPAPQFRAEWPALRKRMSADEKSGAGRAGATKRRVVLLAVPPVRELDLAGIVEVFVSANSLLPEDRHYVIEIASTEMDPLIRGMHGLHFAGGRPYATVKGEIDTLLISGGVGAKSIQPPRALLSWLRKCEPRTRRLGSVCTGFWPRGRGRGCRALPVLAACRLGHGGWRWELTGARPFSDPKRAGRRKTFPTAGFALTEVSHVCFTGSG